jgi:hypothetical protein
MPVVPLRHKLIAACLAAALAAACLVEARRLPQQYTASATLLFDASIAPQSSTGALSQEEKPAEALAQSILSDDVLKTLATRMGLISAKAKLSAEELSAQTVRLRSQLILTQIAPAKLRVTWQDADPAQTTAMANAVTNLLASWVPVESPPSPAPASVVPATPVPAASLQVHQNLSQLKAREATLHQIGDELDVQMDRTDQRLLALGVGPPPSGTVAREAAQLRAERARLDQQKESIDQMVKQLHAQQLEAARAIQASAVSAHTSSVPAAPASQTAPKIPTRVNPAKITAETPTASPTDPPADLWKSPFTLIEAAGEAKPADPRRLALQWLGSAAALLCGLLWLLLAVWRFRAVYGVAALERILPGDVALLGAVPRLGMASEASAGAKR